jgi:hypothetical protein
MRYVVSRLLPEPDPERDSFEGPTAQCWGALGSVLVGQAALKQVQLAAQAQAERRVQEGRDECDRCGDRHRGGEAEGCQEQPSTDDQQSDKLGEAWWAGVLQLGWRGQPGGGPMP